MEKQKLRKIIITLSFLTLLCCFFFVSSAMALSTSGSYVYKVNKGSPAIELDKYRVSTITRGGAANQPFKVLTQTVPKVLAAKVLKKFIGLTPWGIGLIVAYDLFFAEDGSISTQSTAINIDTLTSGTQEGSCQGGIGGNRTLQDCVAYAQTIDYVFVGVLDQSGAFLWGHAAGWHETHWQVINGGLNPEIPPPEAVPYTDEQLLQDVDDYIAANPTLNHNDMFNDEFGNVIPEMFPNPEYVEFTQADIDLIELYEAGLMQSDDPNAANYYPPETIAKAKLLSETKAAQDAKTAEQEAKDLTEDEKLPITQAQHKTNQVEQEARQEATMAESVSALTGIDLVEKKVDVTASVDDGWTDMTTMLNTTNDLPSSNFANYFDFTSSTGCETIPLPYFGVFPNAEQCVKLGTVKTFLAYFLSVLLAWNMINTVLKEAN